MPTDIVKGFGPVRRSHAVDLHDDETEVGQRLIPTAAAESLRHKRTMRPRVNIFDDRVLLFRIEIARSANDAPDIGFAITAFRNERFGGLPAVLPEF